MDPYGARYERELKNYEAYEKIKKKRETEAASQFGDQIKAKRTDWGDSFLSKDQILELKDKYNPVDMSYEEEEALIIDLKKMGILTKEDCDTYSITGGNIIASLKKRISDDFNLLYKIAISGKDDTLHIEHIRSQQKVLDVVEQMIDE